MMAHSNSRRAADAASLDDACTKAMNLQLAGHLDLAEQLYRAVLMAAPAHAAANHCFGMLQLQSSRPAEGLSHLLTALNANPELSDYWLGYLEALLAGGMLDTAKTTLTLAHQHGLAGAAVKDFAQRLDLAMIRLGEEDAALLLALQEKRFADALAQARAMTECFPEHGPGWKSLGALLGADGRPEEALSAMQTSLGLLPEDAECHTNLAMILMRLKRFEEAETHLNNALQINPTFAAAHYRLAMCCELQGRYADSELRLRAAIPLRSTPPTADDEQSYSHLLSMQSYNPALDADALFAEHRRYGEYLETSLRASWPAHANGAEAERRLKIGFVSGDLYEHAVGCFLEPVLAALSRLPGVALHAYYNNTREDVVGARLRGYVEHWNPVAARTDAELAQQITDDGIDILIDLSGHTGLNRLRTFARKPAPIQVSWLGYPGTTGLTAMDYYLTDRHWLPPGEFDAQFTEKLVYLPDRWVFEPHPSAPAVNALPALKTSHLTFGSFNRLGKVNLHTVRLWSSLLRALPDAKMLVGGMPSAGEQRLLSEQFAAQGISLERLHFHGRVVMDVYLGLHHLVDICLDTQPYAGGTTTMHAQWMGVPTLTIAGATSFARAGAGILGQIGLDGFTAADGDDFVAKGVYWSTHLAELAHIRHGLRERVRQLPGGDAEFFAGKFERALRHMWRRWCRALPAESFDTAAIKPPRLAQEDASRDHKSQDMLIAPQHYAAVVAMVERGDVGEATILAQELIERFPDYGLGWKASGALLWWKGSVAEALAPMQTAARLLPDDVEAHSNLGMVLLKLRRFEDAVSCLEQALKIDQNFAAAHYHLGMAYVVLERYTAAEIHLRAAFSLSPDYLSSEKDTIYSDFLLLLSNNPAVSVDSLFAEHRRFGEHFENTLRASWPRHANLKDPDRRLRVGFVSGDLNDHAVAYFLEPVLARLGLFAKVELHAYYNHVLEDAVTARLRGHIAYWHSVAALSDAELAHKIRDDGIDILIDLSGHTGLNRLRTFARKPAPLQVSWLGYPGTTGLRAMDYYLADRHWLPPGEFDRQFTEKLVYLPDRWTFQPHASAPAVNDLPALNGDRLTFGSFNRIGKINGATIGLWSMLLRALPEAQLLLAGMKGEADQKRMIDLFATEGIARERLIFHDRATMDAYLGLHHQVDICLDTQPYAGGTTTMHALWMGVPTLTIAGSTSFARAGAGILGQIGLDGFIANDAADFVAKGLYWASRLGELAAIRAGLRARMQQRLSGRPEFFAAQLESALRHMWKRWCAGLPAESFDHTEGSPTSTAKPTKPPKQKKADQRRRELAVQQKYDELLATIDQGNAAEALVQARAMTTSFSDHGLGWKTLGVLLWRQGLTGDALLPMQTSVRLLPRDVEAHSNLGMLLLKLQRLDEAEDCLRRALTINRDFTAAHMNLGLTHLVQGRYAEAEANLRRASVLKPDSNTDLGKLHSILLFLASNNPKSAGSLFKEHCRFAERFESPLRASWPQHRNHPAADRCLRIGFVSGDLRDHAVAYFLEPVLAGLSRRHDLELHTYYNHVDEDVVSARLRGHVKHWNAVALLSDDALAQKIMDDGIDILIDLSGHTARNRLRAFARKPAPLQVSWLGYPGTTGLRAMDYYLADPHWLPPGEYDSQFTEKLVYLGDRWTFQPHAAAPAVNALPALNAGYLTFGSFNHIGKLNRVTIALWSTLLRALPDAKLLLGAMPSHGEQRLLSKQFAAEGVARERLQFHGRGTIEVYLGLHHHVDICLDTQPYAGGTTTMHALWMGVPTLTVAGPTSFARAGAGILGQIGLDGFTAADAADFVAKGGYWARHLADLATVRAALRDRMRQAPSGKPEVFVAQFAAALRQMWRRWCAGLPAESFHSGTEESVS